MPIKYEVVDINRIHWEELDSLPDRTIFQTAPWLNFIAKTQKAELLIAALREENRILGYLTGMIIKKLGVRIFGSPFPGWTTNYMGFNLLPSVSYKSALDNLSPFVFNELKCDHFEICDRNISIEDCQSLKMAYRTAHSFEIDLTKTEEDLLSGMDTKSCRWCIHKAEKSGVIIEEVHDIDFADDYYSQLVDVFAKQSLAPTYGIERVKALIECVYPTGSLLLLRARDPNGACIATGIFPAMNDTMYFFGGASWRKYQFLRPNELVVWYAMKYWKNRGMRKFDFGGAGEYKRKYGGYEITVPWLRKSKYPIFEYLRNGAKNIFSLKQRILGLSKR